MGLHVTEESAFRIQRQPVKAVEGRNRVYRDHTKHVNVLRGQNAMILDAKGGCAFNNLFGSVGEIGNGRFLKENLVLRNYPAIFSFLTCEVEMASLIRTSIYKEHECARF